MSSRDTDHTELRFRQVHLDYHIPADIPDLARDFDAEEFADTIEAARIDSVTCFARCHNGWMYYDSARFPERNHPRLLRRNLLGEQIEALHRRGIRAPVYITVQWDHYTSQRHADWCVLAPDGRIDGTPPLEPGFYRYMCLNHEPYLDFLRAHTQEVLEMFPVDGFFFDILWRRECVCPVCKAEMLARGMNPLQREDRQAQATLVLNRFMTGMTDFVRQFNSDCTIYYNNGDVRPGNRSQSPAFTHFEFDVLPSAWSGGYISFPARARFERNLGQDCMGMTGKFHRGWGDVHTLKNQAALEYECFQLLALNCKCSVGDQMHPLGRLEPETYDLIGKVYSQVESKEAWCRGAQPACDIAVLSAEEFGAGRDSMLGMVRMLAEGGHQFNILDSAMDFSGYKLVILPDRIPVDGELKQKLQQYLADGGSLIASFESGLDPAQTGFALDELGVTYRGAGPLGPDGLPARGRLFQNADYCETDYADYLRPRPALAGGVGEMDWAMYTKCVEVDAAPGSEVLADAILPYYYRTFEHFCSHQQTPTSGQVGSAGAVRNGKVIYFAHAIGDLYALFAPRWVRQMFLNAVDLLLPEPLLRHNGPKALEATVNEQPAQNRRVMHLLYYVPERRAHRMEIIEDVIPLYNIQASLREDVPVTSVKLVPEGQPLPFTREAGRITFTVPELRGHQIVEVS